MSVVDIFCTNSFVKPFAIRAKILSQSWCEGSRSKYNVVSLLSVLKIGIGMVALSECVSFWNAYFRIVFSM